MENGTIYFSQSLNCYVAQYHEPSGKRKTLKQKKNEKVGEFKSRFNKIITDINQGSYIEKSFDTCLSIIKNYVEQKHDDGITSDRTYIRDLGTINQLEACCNNWINKPIQKVSAFDIEQSKKSIR